MNDMTPEELAEMIARYRYNSVHDRSRIERLTVENIELHKQIEFLKKQIESNGQASA
jgi:hypothetical protein